MAISFPVSLAAFFADIAIVDLTFDVTENRKNSRLLGGGSSTSIFGTRYWFGDVLVKRYPRAKVEDVVARIRTLQRGGATFLVSPVHVNQTAIGTTATFVSSSNAYSIALSGLPANRLIPRGTFLSWTFGNGRRALHSTAEAVTANASGVTGQFEIDPAIVGDPTGATVQIAQPVCLAQIVPGSFSAPRRQVAVAGNMSFSWEQIV